MAGSRVARATDTLCARCGHRVAQHMRVPPAGAGGSTEPGRVLCAALIPQTLGGNRLCGCSLV